MLRLVSFIVLLFVLIIGIYFGLLNADPVSVNYYFGAYEMPLSLLLVATLLTGALLGAVASIGIIFRMRKRISNLKREVSKQERELENNQTLVQSR